MELKNDIEKTAYILSLLEKKCSGTFQPISEVIKMDEYFDRLDKKTPVTEDALFEAISLSGMGKQFSRDEFNRIFKDIKFLLPYHSDEEGVLEGYYFPY